MQVRRHAWWRAAVVATGATLVMAGCEVDGGTGGPTTSVGASPTVAGLERFYAQSLDWAPCEDDPDFTLGWSHLDGLECAWLTVPVDYAEPDGATLQIAVDRSVAPHSTGSVVVNPGGPGGSGVEMVPSLAVVAGDRLADSLDLVGFDPRGVQRSAPVVCTDDDAPLPDVDPALVSADADLEQVVDDVAARNAEYEAGCRARAGSLLDHMDAVSVARDMDVLRAALGERQLTYLGLSWGTELGATYASLFPDRAGRLVLDGAVDPTRMSEVWLDGATRAESELRTYVTDCLAAGDCPLTGSVDEAVSQVGTLLDQTKAQPMGTGTDQDLTYGLALDAIVVSLQGGADSWPALTEALRAAVGQHDGAGLLAIASPPADPAAEDEGPRTQGAGAPMAALCADAMADTDPATVVADLEQIRTAAPTVGSFYAADALTCVGWPAPAASRLASYTAEGAPPIVVIGNTGDLITPYASAQRLATILDSGVLVTWRGVGHTAYVHGDECVQTTVDRFLVDGDLPADGLTCPLPEKA